MVIAEALGWQAPADDAEAAEWCDGVMQMLARAEEEKMRLDEFIAHCLIDFLGGALDRVGQVRVCPVCTCLLVPLLVPVPCVTVFTCVVRLRCMSGCSPTPTSARRSARRPRPPPRATPATPGRAVRHQAHRHSRGRRKVRPRSCTLRGAAAQLASAAAAHPHAPPTPLPCLLPHRPCTNLRYLGALHVRPFATDARWPLMRELEAARARPVRHASPARAASLPCAAKI